MKKLMIALCATALISSNMHAAAGKMNSNQTLFNEMMSSNGKAKALKKIADQKEMDAKQAAEFAIYVAGQLGDAIDNVGAAKDAGGDIDAAKKNVKKVLAISSVATDKVIETSPKDYPQ